MNILNTKLPNAIKLILCTVNNNDFSEKYIDYLIAECAKCENEFVRVVRVDILLKFEYEQISRYDFAGLLVDNIEAYCKKHSSLDLGIVSEFKEAKDYRVLSRLNSYIKLNLMPDAFRRFVDIIE